MQFAPDTPPVAETPEDPDTDEDSTPPPTETEGDLFQVTWGCIQLQVIYLYLVSQVYNCYLYATNYIVLYVYTILLTKAN